MLELLPLRPYQRQCIDAFQQRWSDNAFRAACEIPTGGGKTFIFAHMAKEHITQHPNDRIIILVHTDELAEQAFAQLCAVAPHLPIGIVKAQRNDVTATIIVGSVQTLRREERRAPITGVGLVIVDECHHATSRSYMDILQHFGCFDNQCRAAGFTATMMRGDGQGLGHVWGHELVFHRDISWMVRKQYLIPPIGKAVVVPDLDLGNVKRSGKDFQDASLGDAMAESLAPGIVARAYVEHASDRKGIAFWPSISAAEVFANAFSAEGIKSEVIHSYLAKDERMAVLERHRTGTIQVLHNVMVLSEGYDDPTISCVVQGRPTTNRGLYKQMVGRGLRIDPARPYEEQNCLILGVTAGAADMSLASPVDLSTRPLKEARDGKTLLELEDEFDAEFGDPEHYYQGPIEIREFDPLATRASRTWIRTTGGTFFVPAGTNAYVFIFEYPSKGRWSVAWCTKESRIKLYACEVPSVHCDCVTPHPARQVATTEHRDLDLEMALTWAEDLAVDMGAQSINLANRKASWRRGKPTDKTVRFARQLGIEVPVRVDEPTGLEIPLIKAGELSDQITTLIASRRIDPLVNAVRGTR